MSICLPGWVDKQKTNSQRRDPRTLISRRTVKRPWKQPGTWDSRTAFSVGLLRQLDVGHSLISAGSHCASILLSIHQDSSMFQISANAAGTAIQQEQPLAPTAKGLKVPAGACSPRAADGPWCSRLCSLVRHLRSPPSSGWRRRLSQPAFLLRQTAFGREAPSPTEPGPVESSD